MQEIGIMEISKTPSLINKIDEVVKIINKKTKEPKGYFIPIRYEEMIKKVIEEIEYQNFKKRNKSLIDSHIEEDDTLLDGLDDEY